MNKNGKSKTIGDFRTFSTYRGENKKKKEKGTQIL